MKEDKPDTKCLLSASTHAIRWFCHWSTATL